MWGKLTIGQLILYVLAFGAVALAVLMMISIATSPLLESERSLPNWLAQTLLPLATLAGFIAAAVIGRYAYRQHKNVDLDHKALGLAICISADIVSIDRHLAKLKLLLEIACTDGSKGSFNAALKAFNSARIRTQTLNELYADEIGLLPPPLAKGLAYLMMSELELHTSLNVVPGDEQWQHNRSRLAYTQCMVCVIQAEEVNEALERFIETTTARLNAGSVDVKIDTEMFTIRREETIGEFADMYLDELKAKIKTELENSHNHRAPPPKSSS